MLSKIKVPSWWIGSDYNDIIREINGLVIKNVVEYSELDTEAMLLINSDSPSDFFDSFTVEIASAVLDESVGVSNDHWLTAAFEMGDILDLLSSVSASNEIALVGWNANRN